jgi:acyl-CoA thioesterase
MTDQKTPAQLMAEQVAGAMFERDQASRALGMEIQSVGPGYACLRMRVRKDMLNGHQTCHGGFIFSLADSAFAFACNSRNESTVAAGCQIEFLLPGYEGDVLQAEAVEKALSGKSGVYDISVINQHGKLIAVFRGKSHRIKGFVVPELDLTKTDCTEQQAVCT